MIVDMGKAREIRSELVNRTSQSIRAYWRSVGVPDSEGDERSVVELIFDLCVNKLSTDQGVAFRTVIISLGDGGKSFKLGNLWLDLRKLLTVISTSTLSFVGAVAVPWTTPLAVLLVLDALRETMTKNITEKQASVLYTLWSRGGQAHSIGFDKMLVLVNEDRSCHGYAAITPGELRDAIATLQHIGCIEQSGDNPKKWRLRERIQLKGGAVP